MKSEGERLDQGRTVDMSISLRNDGKIRAKDYGIDLMLPGPDIL
jgi:hypothetical protein